MQECRIPMFDQHAISGWHPFICFPGTIVPNAIHHLNDYAIQLFTELANHR